VLHKSYSCETSSGAFCGCYVFASEDSPQAFRQSELARTIPADYQEDENRVEGYPGLPAL
jgi:hypothetical protein